MQCEKCWGDAYLAARVGGGTQVDHYKRIFEYRQKHGRRCSPKESAGQFWDPVKKRDSRLPEGQAGEFV